MIDFPIEEIVCEARITWYVNNEVVSETDIGDGQVPPLIYEFPTPGKYIIKLRVCTCCGCCEKEQIVNIGPSLYLERDNCLIFILRDYNDYFNLKIEINLYDSDKNKTNLISSDSYSGRKDFRINLPYDGVYYLEYIIRDEAGNIVKMERFVLYEFCSILQCFKRFMMSLNCENCDPCDNDIQERIRLQDQIQLFMFNFFAFSARLAIHSGLNYGHFYFRDEYASFLDETALVLKQLLKVCSKCGYIDKPHGKIATIHHITTPCTTCQ